jgi:hypothetical protein
VQNLSIFGIIRPFGINSASRSYGKQDNFFEKQLVTPHESPEERGIIPAVSEGISGTHFIKGRRNSRCNKHQE